LYLFSDLKSKVSQKNITIEGLSSNTISSQSTNCSNNNDNLKSPETNELDEIHAEHKKSGNILIPNSNTKIRNIITRKKIGENPNTHINYKINKILKNAKENIVPNIINRDNIIKKVSIEDIELVNLNDKSEKKILRSVSKHQIVKPSFSTRNVNVLNYYNKNNDVSKKIESLKNPLKSIIGNINNTDLNKEK